MSDVFVSTCTYFKTLKLKSSKLSTLHNNMLTNFNFQNVWGGGGPDTRYKDVNRFENS